MVKKRNFIIGGLLLVIISLFFIFPASAFGEELHLVKDKVYLMIC